MNLIQERVAQNDLEDNIMDEEEIELTPLSEERKAELKGTMFERCETEEEVVAVHFILME